MLVIVLLSLLERLLSPIPVGGVLYLPPLPLLYLALVKRLDFKYFLAGGLTLDFLLGTPGLLTSTYLLTYLSYSLLLKFFPSLNTVILIIFRDFYVGFLLFLKYSSLNFSILMFIFHTILTSLFYYLIAKVIRGRRKLKLQNF